MCSLPTFLRQCQDSHNVSMSHLCVEELTGQSVATIFCLLIAFVLFFGYLLPQHLQAETELCSIVVACRFCCSRRCCCRYFFVTLYTHTLTLTHANLRFALLLLLARNTKERDFPIIITISFKLFFHWIYNPVLPLHFDCASDSASAAAATRRYAHFTQAHQRWANWIVVICDFSQIIKNQQ